MTSAARCDVDVIEMMRMDAWMLGVVLVGRIMWSDFSGSHNKHDIESIKMGIVCLHLH